MFIIVFVWRWLWIYTRPTISAQIVIIESFLNMWHLRNVILIFCSIACLFVFIHYPYFFSLHEYVREIFFYNVSWFAMFYNNDQWLTSIFHEYFLNFKNWLASKDCNLWNYTCTFFLISPIHFTDPINLTVAKRHITCQQDIHYTADINKSYFDGRISISYSSAFIIALNFGGKKN